MSSKFGLVLDSVFLQHLVPADHPERPERIESIIQHVRSWAGSQQLITVEPVHADPDWIRQVHTAEHFSTIHQTDGSTPGALDWDTHAGGRSFEVAMLAAGSVVRMIELLFAGEIETGFAAIRPPGHHAETARAMGFCLFNNIAVGAEWACRQGLAERVAVVDFDVHHGNGTQEIFYRRPDVLYLSSHQYPFYPGTGSQAELGDGKGLGFTVNFPMSAGSGNHFFCSLFQDLAGPILRDFEPDLILVSTGYDAHRDDPLGGMRLDEAGFGELVRQLNGLAKKLCQGRILYVLEGGYNLRALGQSVLSTLRMSLDPTLEEIERTQTREYESYRQRISRTLSPYWSLPDF